MINIDWHPSDWFIAFEFSIEYRLENNEIDKILNSCYGQAEKKT